MHGRTLALWRRSWALRAGLRSLLLEFLCTFGGGRGRVRRLCRLGRGLGVEGMTNWCWRERRGVVYLAVVFLLCARVELERWVDRRCLPVRSGQGKESRVRIACSLFVANRPRNERSEISLCFQNCVLSSIAFCFDYRLYCIGNAQYVLATSSFRFLSTMIPAPFL